MCKVLDAGEVVTSGVALFIVGLIECKGVEQKGRLWQLAERD